MTQRCSWTRTWSVVLTMAFATLVACVPPPDKEIAAGRWRATVELPGGELPFLIELDTETPAAFVLNGAERVPVEQVRVERERITLEFTGFNNRIVAELRDGVLVGELILAKRGGVEQRMPLRAAHGRDYRFFPVDDPSAADPAGRWDVRFTDANGTLTQAVAELERDGGLVTGTFMTPTGDYRYLAGQVRADRLYLSTFDGAHAFLFTAAVGDGELTDGDFWSGTAWHETWSARRDETAALPDANMLTYLKDGYRGLEFSFPDEQGRAVSLDDARFRGKVVVVTLVGSWCPNCHDEAAFMAPLYRRYRTRGLEVIALMYEHSGDFDEAARRARAFRDKLGIEYATLIAGISDKDEAADTLPMLNHVLAFPTTVFVDRSGRVRRIHTGFTGPGTGAHYERLTRDFTAFVEALLAEHG